MESKVGLKMHLETDIEYPLMNIQLHLHTICMAY